MLTAFFLKYSVFIIGFASWSGLLLYEYIKYVDNCKGMRDNALMERYIKVEQLKKKGKRL